MGKKANLTPVERLQDLSLVKKVSEEMAPHMGGLQDKTLSEFCISMTESVVKKMMKSSDRDDIKAARDLLSTLAENGAPNLPLSVRIYQATVLGHI